MRIPINIYSINFLKKKESLESKYGEPLEWEPLEEKRACRIAAYRNEEIDDDSETLEEIKIWTIERLLKFKEIFRPIIADIIQ
jgi:hypothetical protein